MANVPEDLHYSKDHEWVRVDGEEAIIGITDYAQNSLGDVVYVELPKAGDEFGANESFGSVESVKAVSEVFTPVAGVVSRINESLADEPEKVNSDPYGEGWMVRLRMSNAGEVDSLLTAAEYEDFTKAESE
jgi:glycine cleavage system H protein